jgi:AmiR/NasT family two-component response regulator
MMVQKAHKISTERHGELNEESKLDRAIDILMKRLDISERDAKGKIAILSQAKNLDTEKTCEVLIRLASIIDDSWFENSPAR